MRRELSFPAVVPELLIPPPPGITLRLLRGHSTLNVDTYILTASFSWSDPNFAPVNGANSVFTTVQFTATNNGG